MKIRASRTATHRGYGSAIGHRLARISKSRFKGKGRFPMRRGIAGKPVRATAVRTLPDSMLVKLPYYSQNVGTATGVLASHLFNLNNLFDPDATGGGHQPRGRDQWATLYSRYRVVGIKVTLRGCSLTAGSASIIGMVACNSQQATLADLTDAMENQRTYKRKVQSSGASCKITKYFRPWVLEGITRTQYMDDAIYSAAVGAAPSSQQFLQVFWACADETSTVGHNVTVEFDFYTIFDVPVNLGVS